MSDKSGNTETHCQLFETGDVQTVDLVKYVDWPLDDNKNSFFPLIQLPPFQRGDVWKVAQVERLWDSVLRGFPIGSFLLTPFEAGKPSRSIDSPEQKLADRNGWFLLDGQQRTRALILGFHPKKQTARLWIDMAPQTSSMLDRAFFSGSAQSNIRGECSKTTLTERLRMLPYAKHVSSCERYSLRKRKR